MKDPEGESSNKLFEKNKKTSPAVVQQNLQSQSSAEGETSKGDECQQEKGFMNTLTAKERQGEG